MKENGNGIGMVGLTFGGDITYRTFVVILGTNIGKKLGSSHTLAEIFCTTMSTLIEFFDNGLNIDAAIPGLSSLCRGLVCYKVHPIHYIPQPATVRSMHEK